MAGVAEFVAVEHVAHGGFRLFQGHRHDHALAGGQAVGLDYDGRALLAHIGEGFVHIGEVAVGGGGDVLAGQKVLGEGLGAFQLGSGLAGAEALQAAALEVVHQAVHQRRLGADDGQRHAFALGQVGQAGLIVDVQGHVFQLGVAGGAGVARRHQHFLHLFRLRHFPGQGVLAATAADDQDFHGLDSLMLA